MVLWDSTFIIITVSLSNEPGNKISWCHPNVKGRKELRLQDVRRINSYLHTLTLHTVKTRFRDSESRKGKETESLTPLHLGIHCFLSVWREEWTRPIQVTHSSFETTELSHSESSINKGFILDWIDYVLYRHVSLSIHLYPCNITALF